MAGFYPDVPAPRMAYDRDGSVGFILNHPGTGGPTQIMTPSELASMNSEGGPTSPFSSWNTMSLGVIFPELRDVTGLTLQALAGYATDWGIVEVTTSTNTTNGVDGIWVSRAGIVKSDAPENPGYRTGINVVSWTGIKAVRWRVSSNGSGNRSANAHIYGKIASGQTPDRLRMWHPTLDEPLDDNTAADGAWLDYGDSTRGTSADKTFRIKNNSATLTANSIDVSFAAPTNTTPSLLTQFSVSDGGAFGPSVTISSLAPGVISGVVTVRRTTSATATLNVWALRITADPTSWS